MRNGYIAACAALLKKVREIYVESAMYCLVF